MCSPTRLAGLLWLLLVVPAFAAAEEPAQQPEQPEQQAPPPPAAAPSPSAAADILPSYGTPQVLRVARDRFEFGDYEQVVTLLRPLVEAAEAGTSSDPDQLEALRTYGIACTLTGRRIAAEGAFLLLLRQQPQTRLDPALVRPEAVAFFESVRSRRQRELQRAAGRRYVALNFLPPAGQLQNRQPAKAAVVGGAAVVLLAANITTAVLLNGWRGPTQEYAGHKDDARAAMAVNVASFVGVIGALVYGVVDGLVIGHRLSRIQAGQH